MGVRLTDENNNISWNNLRKIVIELENDEHSSFKYLYSKTYSRSPNTYENNEEILNKKLFPITFGGEHCLEQSIAIDVDIQEILFRTGNIDPTRHVRSQAVAHPPISRQGHSEDPYNVQCTM